MKYYGLAETQKKPVLNNISCSIQKGSFTGIMGSSGSGKSTLLNLISTIDDVSSGEIIVMNKDITKMSEMEAAKFRQDNLGFIFQEYNLLDTLTIRENISLALIVKKIKAPDINKAVEQLSMKLGIDNLLDKYPYEVSGGQKQRAACAQAIVTKPKLILADEPTGALDSKSAQNFMKLIKSLNEELGITVLLVTHDIVSASYCDKILFMEDGEIIDEILENGKGRIEFFQCLLNKLAVLREG